MKIWGTFVLLVVLSVGGFVMFSWLCPCERTPGAYLFGPVAAAPVEDWSFANEVPLCQLEVRSWRPHAINLNCMSADGVLYVSCSNCAGKYWSGVALDTGSARIRIDGVVYLVSVRRVTDTQELDLAWQARAQKLGREPSPRPDHWWSFHLQSS